MSLGDRASPSAMALKSALVGAGPASATTAALYPAVVGPAAVATIALIAWLACALTVATLIWVATWQGLMTTSSGYRRALDRVGSRTGAGGEQCELYRDQNRVWDELARGNTAFLDPWPPTAPPTRLVAATIAVVVALVAAALILT